MAALLALAPLKPAHAEGARGSAALAHAGGASAKEKLPAEVVPQIGHTEPIDSVAFSPDGRFALSGSCGKNRCKGTLERGQHQGPHEIVEYCHWLGAALMEARHQGDANNNGKIEVSELAAHFEKRVPELFPELKQNGWVVKGATAPAARGTGIDKQSARFGSTREDFAIVARLP
jgi:hypothetical protein